MRNGHMSYLLQASVAAVCLGAIQAQAQTQISSESDRPVALSMSSEAVAEIVVTAQRREERLQDVPVSVSVVTSGDLEAQAIRSIEDLGARQPNLAIVPTPSSDQLRIRGSGSGYNPGFEQSVATFVDGIYRSRSRSIRVALFDVEQVEILRGPQTTFFGANAIAGALNITTRKPNGVFEGNTSALYASDDGEFDVEAGVSLPVTNSLGVRLAGRFAGMDGYLSTPGTNIEGPSREDTQARATVVWEPSDVLSVSARFDYAKLDGDNILLGSLLNCPSTAGAMGQCARTIGITGQTYGTDLSTNSTQLFGGFADLDMKESALIASLDLGPASIISTSGYQDQQYNAADNISPFPVPSLLGTTAYLGFLQQDNLKQFSQELRLQSNESGLLDYMVGLYYEDQQLTVPYMGLFYFAPLGLAAAPVYDNTSLIASRVNQRQDSTTYSAFASVTLHPTDSLKLTASLRYSDVQKDAVRNVVFGTNQPNPTFDGFVPGPPSVQGPLSGATGTSLAPFASPTADSSELMPAGNITYNFTQDVSVYTSYSHGFKAGGFSSTTPDVFQPEYVDAYEVGLKSQWLERRVTANIAVFRSDYDGLQDSANQLLPNGGIQTQITNVSASRSQGVELSTAFFSDNGFRVRADVAYLDAEYQNFKNAPCSPLNAAANPNCLLDLSGQQQSYSPEWSGSVSLDQTLQFFWNSDVNLGATVYFTDSFFTQTTNDPVLKQDGYAKLDVRAAWTSPDNHVTVAVIGRNVTDKLTANFQNYVPAAAGSTFAIVDRPRSIAVQASYRW